MRVQILQVGETKDKNLIALEREYEKRLRPFANIESVTVNASKFDDDRARAQEAETILKKIKSDAFVIAMDETGKQFSSEEFAALILEQRDFGPGKIQFIIGGSHGLDTAVRKKAKLILSFSRMTFTHEMIRPFLKEQIYRAFTILAGKAYHK